MCSCAILSMLSRFVLMLRTSWLGSPTSAIRVRLDYLISHNPPKTESCTQPFSGRTRVEIVTAHDWLAATLSTSRLQRATSRCQLAYPVARDPQLFAEKKIPRQAHGADPCGVCACGASSCERSPHPPKFPESPPLPFSIPSTITPNAESTTRRHITTKWPRKRPEPVWPLA